MSDSSAFTSCERFLEETRDVSPAHLLMKIERFSLFSEYGINKCESRVFEAGGHKWKMITYREGCESENHERNVFGIAETESLSVGWEVNAILAFFVYNHHMNNYLCFRGTMRRLNALITRCGFTKVISMDTLINPTKGFLVDDSCVFGAEVFVIKNQPSNECLSLVNDAVSFKREWKISGFSKLNCVWTSEQFKVGDHKWKVEVYPNKGETDSKEEDHYISVYVECVDIKSSAPHHKVKVEAIIRIKSKINIDQHSKTIGNIWFTPASSAWGHREFISIVDMKKRGFLVDDCCFLEVEISAQA